MRLGDGIFCQQLDNLHQQDEAMYFGAPCVCLCPR